MRACLAFGCSRALSLDRPLHFTLTGGHVHDSQAVEDVLDTPKSPLVVTADKAYNNQKAPADQG